MHSHSGWILLDYGDIIIHIMTPKSRAYYDLDAFWRSGEVVDLSSILVPNAPAAKPSQYSDDELQDVEVDEEEEIDPFWS
jgi:Ribosomal silencing factor during starvation